VALVWVLALIGLATLVGLAVLALVSAARTPVNPEPEDAFDVALAAVSRLQAGAWSAIQELRDLDQRGKE
jgi:hypothetical protein